MVEAPEPERGAASNCQRSRDEPVTKPGGHGLGEVGGEPVSASDRPQGHQKDEEGKGVAWVRDVSWQDWPRRWGGRK
jgi:hypothetical protein